MSLAHNGHSQFADSNTGERLDADGNPTGGWGLDELRSIQDWYVRYGLLSAKGVSEAEITARILNTFDLTPYGIKETLQLERPIFRATAAYGHFGRDGFSWEKTDKADDLRSAAG